MKVHELIKLLQQQDQNAHVVISTPDIWCDGCDSHTGSWHEDIIGISKGRDGKIVVFVEEEQQ